MTKMQGSNMNNIGRKAFTLLELLIVVAIIAILSANLLSATSKVRQSSTLLQCKDNLKNIGMGFNLYASEWNDCLPKRVGDYTNEKATCWPMRIDPYMDNSQDWTHGAWRCPNNTSRSSMPVSVCYGMVEVKFESHVNGSQVPEPSSSILLGEGRPFWDIDSYSLRAPYGLEPQLHYGWVNLLYADLHVQGLKTEVLQGISEFNLPWDIDLNG